jgi:hypothetical protein
MPAMKSSAFAAAALLAACASPPAMDPADNAQSLAAAERAFAAHSVREDMRSAFLAAFSEDGVLVQRGWARAHEVLAPKPAPPIVLEWRPVYVEAARSGDIGLSTGPWRRTVRTGGPPDHGQFVSVWRREGDAWKVLIDIGIANRGAMLWDAPLQAVERVAAAGPGVDTAESAFAELAARAGALAAYRAHAAADMRFYRDDTGPLQGRDAALAVLAKDSTHPAFMTEATYSARSGELAFVRGRSARPDTVFMRAWRREAGEWRIALDVANALR